MLAELDSFIGYCNDKGVDKQLITDINIKTLTYIKNCNKQKPTTNDKEISKRTQSAYYFV